MRERVHATAVAWGPRAVLLRGSPGSGKSSLALALAAQNWMLVGDDQVDLSVSEGALAVAPAGNLRGWLEVRGVGIAAHSYRLSAIVGLVVDLVPDPPRLPEPLWLTLLGIRVPQVALCAHDAALPAAVTAALIKSSGQLD
jgi:HPr kinase/phosphorylase